MLVVLGLFGDCFVAVNFDWFGVMWWLFSD